MMESGPNRRACKTNVREHDRVPSGPWIGMSTPRERGQHAKRSPHQTHEDYGKMPRSM
jgi:hypothetical protein